MPFETLQGGYVARLIRLRIDQIEFPQDSFKWGSLLNHLPLSVPAVKEAALPLLQILQPVVVAPLARPQNAAQDTPGYRLVGGRRTLQLILEQQTRQTRIQAVLIDAGPALEASLEVMDILGATLIQRPDGRSLALLATALLKDDQFRKASSALVELSSAATVAEMLGVSVATLHRLTGKTKELMAAQKDGGKTSLGISGFDGEAEEP